MLCYVCCYRMPRRTTRRRRTHYTALPTQEDRQHAPGGPIVSVPTPMSKTGIQQTKFIHKLSGRTLETQVDANNPGYLKLHYPADATCDKQSMIIDAECGTKKACLVTYSSICRMRLWQPTNLCYHKSGVHGVRNCIDWRIHQMISNTTAY